LFKLINFKKHKYFETFIQLLFQIEIVYKNNIHIYILNTFSTYNIIIPKLLPNYSIFQKKKSEERLIICHCPALMREKKVIFIK